MKFTVVWLPSAEQDLIQIWLDTSDRNALTSAATYIEWRLQFKPMNSGESREKDRRILIVSPLGVKYEVLEDDRLVRVLQVWEFRTKNQ